MRHVLDTAAGPVELGCRIVGVEPSLVETRWTGSGVRETWSSPGRVEIQVVRADVEPACWEHRRPLDGYVGVVWSLHAHRPCGPLTFGAHLRSPAAEELTGPTSGEHLSAVTYDTDDYALAIGTEDDEALAARTRVGPGRPSRSPLPAHWAPALAVPWSGEHGAREDGTGITIRLPGLLAGDRADLHVAVAWGPKRHPDEVDTWFAVDTDPATILAAAQGPATTPDPDGRT